MLRAKKTPPITYFLILFFLSCWLKSSSLYSLLYSPITSPLSAPNLPSFTFARHPLSLFLVTHHFIWWNISGFFYEIVVAPPIECLYFHAQALWFLKPYEGCRLSPPPAAPYVRRATAGDALSLMVPVPRECSVRHRRAAICGATNLSWRYALSIWEFSIVRHWLWRYAL